MQPEMAGELEVSVGSSVLAREVKSGEERRFTFLGPWDVDVDNGIYSYRAPLSLAFMGKKVGDLTVFDFDGETRQYKIVSIESAILE
jgi:transcription elongation factor GreA